MSEFEDEMARKICSRCKYSEQSFNLLWCILHEWNVASNETCHSFEMSLEDSWLFELAKLNQRK